MVPLLFSPEDTVVTISEKNFDSSGPQEKFPLQTFQSIYNELRPETAAEVLGHVYITRFLLLHEF